MVDIAKTAWFHQLRMACSQHAEIRASLKPIFLFVSCTETEISNALNMCFLMAHGPDLRIMWCLNPSRPGIAKAQHTLCSALVDSVNHGCTDSCECRPTCRSLLTAASRSLLITQEGRKEETDLSFVGSRLSALWGSWSAFQTWKGSEGGEDCQCRVSYLFGSEEAHKNLLEILS